MDGAGSVKDEGGGGLVAGIPAWDPVAGIGIWGTSAGGDSSAVAGGRASGAVRVVSNTEVTSKATTRGAVHSAARDSHLLRDFSEVADRPEREAGETEGVESDARAPDASADRLQSSSGARVSGSRSRADCVTDGSAALVDCGADPVTSTEEPKLNVAPELASASSAAGEAARRAPKRSAATWRATTSSTRFPTLISCSETGAATASTSTGTVPRNRSSRP